MTRGKQYVKKVVGILGQKRKQKGGAIPIGLLATIGHQFQEKQLNQYLENFWYGSQAKKGLKRLRRR